MRIVAVGAIPRCSRMWHFGLLDLFCLVAVASHANALHVRLCEDNLAVSGGRVTKVAGLIGERRMQKLAHQFGRSRLMRIMATCARCRGERLIVMRLLQVCALGVVAVETK